MRLDEIVYDLSTVRSMTELTDDNMTLSQVTYWVTTTRAQLIRQAINKGQQPTVAIQQTIPCMNVIQVDKSECPDCQPSGCYILRTEQTLPDFIETYKGTLLLRVKSNEVGSVGISIINYERVPYIQANSFTEGITKAFLYRGYIYFLSEVLIDSVTVTGVFEDPADLKNYHDCSGESCFDLTTMDYPMATSMINDLKSMIIQLNFKVATPFSDKVNNSKDDLQSNATQ